MNRCIRNTIATNKLILIIYRNMILVTIENLLALLRPASIEVFLGKNMRIGRNPLRYFTILDLFVLFFRVALSRNLGKRAIGNRAALHLKALLFKFFVEAVEQ